jgi:hypothetical protein
VLHFAIAKGCLIVGRKPYPKTSEERSAENARYQARNAAVGIVKVAVHVPAERVPELRAIALTWRAEAKLLMDVDHPTADQILQIHGICRTLDLDLPVAAFATCSSAAHWLLAQQRQIGQRRVQKPKVRHPPNY